MQILARYLSVQFLKNVLTAQIGLAGLFFFQAIITQLNDFTLAQLLIFNFYDLPNMVVMVAPPAVLLATILTFSQLSKTSELIACFSIGISLKQMILVIMPIVFVLGCISLVIQDRILPVFHEKKSLFYWREIKNKKDFFLDVQQDKIWYRSDSLIYHLRSFDPKSETIQGVGVYVLSPEFKLSELLQAEVGLYQGESQGWLLKNGKSTQFSKETGFPMISTFKERVLKIKEKPADFKVIEKEIDRLRIKDLMKFIERNKKSGIDSKAFETKLHARFSLSFIPLVMCLLAVPFSVSRTREGRTGRDMAFAFAITFFYWLAFSLSLSMGQSGSLPPAVAAWGPTVLFSMLAVFLLMRMQRSSSS